MRKELLNMRRLTVTRLVVLLFALTLLVAGCAKKPVVEEPVVEQPARIEMRQQQPVGVSEQQVGDYGHDAFSADTAAAAAANAAAAKEAALAAAKGLQTIHFEFDQYVLTSSAKQILDANANLLKAAPAVNILVEGHCDERGSDEYNLALGQKRALATQDYLISLGIARYRISVISYGEELPLESARSEDAWAMNRRAEFKIKR
jgi:peptidoglycan-associated lipoprotein